MIIMILFFGFFLSFIISYYLQVKIIKFSISKNLFDRREDRKLKKKECPRLGGIGIFSGFFISSFIILFIFNKYIIKEIKHENESFLFMFFLSIFIIFILGLIDDLIGLNAFQKIPFEILAASVVFINGLNIKIISLLSSPYQIKLSTLASYFVTLLWIVGITNAMNLIDGIDGLAGSIGVVSSVSFIVILLVNKNYSIIILLIIMIGALIGFLRYNIYPSKIYMGDSGSLSLGFFLGVLSLKFSIKASFGLSFLVPVTILLIPILDTFLAFFRRILKSNNPFQADNEHIHHKLLKKGFTEKKAFVFLLILDILFAILGTLSAVINKKFRIILLFVLGIIILILIFYLRYIKVKRD